MTDDKDDNVLKFPNKLKPPVVDPPSPMVDFDHSGQDHVVSPEAVLEGVAKQNLDFLMVIGHLVRQEGQEDEWYIASTTGVRSKLMFALERARFFTME